MRPGLIPQIAPCFVSHNLALGGAQIAVLRLIHALPDWVRERTTLYIQSNDTPLLEPALQAGFSCKAITGSAPADASAWILSYGKVDDLPQRPTSLLLHSWDDEGWRYINKAYGHLKGLTLAGVSQQVLDRFADFAKKGRHHVAGVMPPPVTEFARVKGRRSEKRIVVAWMGRPLESKGIMSLPYLLALDERIVVRCFTGSQTGANAYTLRTQGETMDKFLALCDKLKVRDRLDLRPLDFDPYNYRERLRGCHVLLGNSRREGFLLTAAEALSCGIPVAVTRTCGVAEFVQEGINGSLFNWSEYPRRLARSSYNAIQRAVGLRTMDCLSSAQELSLAASYRDAFGDVLADITHTRLCHDDARVTVGLRIHKGMRIDHLDQAASSLAQQSYKRFKTVLLVDGPWEYGEALAARYRLPLICTGQEPDITHCSSLHRKAVEQCDTEYYKPLDYDDQLLPGYLERAVATLDATKADLYGCLLSTLEGDQISPRWWPNKPLDTMFTGNPNDNQLPHSSALIRTRALIAAGNYNAVAVGLGADDYSVWYRMHKSGARIVRDDEVRNVVYRIHEKNSLKIRKARYGAGATAPGSTTTRGKLVASAAAASLALWLAPKLDPTFAAPLDSKQPAVAQQAPDAGQAKPQPQQKDERDKPKAPQKSKKEHQELVPPGS
jgi:glycosyltransferase involved in cell wall biosynthesis